MAKRASMAAICALVAACGRGDPATDDAAQTAAGPYPFEGRWAQVGTDCSASPGPATDAPLEIRAGALSGPPGDCAITSVDLQEESRGAYGVTLECEGMDPQTIGLRAVDDTLLVQTGGGSETWTRCPAIEDSVRAGPDRPAEVPRSLRGRWVYDPADCDLSKNDAVEIRYGFIFTAQRSHAWESMCDIRTVTPTAEKTWLLHFACTGEGEAFERRYLARLEDDILGLTTSDGHELPLMTYCPMTDDAWWADLD